MPSKLNFTNAPLFLFCSPPSVRWDRMAGGTGVEYFPSGLIGMPATQAQVKGVSLEDWS